MSTELKTSEGEVIVSESLNQKSASLSHPNYRMLRLLPLQGIQTYTLNASRQQIQFEIPQEVFNLAQSYLQFTLTVGAQGAGNMSKIYNDTIAPIASIRLQSRSGAVICDLDYANQAVRILDRVYQEIQEYLSDGARDSLAPSNALVNANGATRFATGNGAINPANVNFIEPTYFQSSAANTAQTKQYMLPLKKFRDTIFEANKDITFPEILILTLNLAPSSEVAFIGTSNTDHSVGIAQLAVQNAQVTNMAMYLAVETNPVFVNLLRDKIARGTYVMPLPYIHYYFNNRAAAGVNGQHAISLRFNSGHGQRLKRIFHIPVSAAGTAGTAYDSSNTEVLGQPAGSAASKVGSYYTTINNRRTSDFNLTCDDVDPSLPTTAWLVHRDTVRGSVAGINENVFLHNGFHLEDLATLGSVEKIKEFKVPKWNLDYGMSLADEVKWDYVAFTNNIGLNHYTFVCVNRTLKVLPNLVIVE